MMTIDKLIEGTMLRRFTKTDWNGFSGAQRLPDGSAPLIGEHDDMAVIISGDDDADIATVEFYTGENCVLRSFNSAEEAVLFCRGAFAANIDRATLLRCGFEITIQFGV